MAIDGTLSGWGFDPARLRFAARTGVAACTALLVAWLLGLEHPQWSAMTVWAASQPTRGMLLEKGFFRATGTVVGVIVGVLLVSLSDGQPVIIVGGLALWIGLCAGVANVQRGFVSYGTILAGYSASMVALLDTAHPDRILSLGIDRLLTVLVGVVVASVIGLLLTPKEAEEPIRQRTRQLTARLFHAMAAHTANPGHADPLERTAILSEMASLEEALDPHSAGSLNSRRSARAIRAVLAAEVSALLWLESTTNDSTQTGLSAALTEVARALDINASPEDILGTLTRATEAASGQAALSSIIAHIATALRHQLSGHQRTPEQPPALSAIVLHRDWIGARQALVRATVTMALAGTVWLVTGWTGGAFMLLGTSVMISLFSTFDNPAGTMRYVFIGQTFGAIAALACRWLVWPEAPSELWLIVMVMPFIILGALPVAHRRTTMGAFDYNMVLLLLLQPTYPLTGTVQTSLAIALAVVTAPIIALLAFRLAFPTDARRRMNTLIAMMVHELQDMAADPEALAHRHIWQARLYHRLLRLVRWTEKAGTPEVSALRGSLAVMHIGSAILCLHNLGRQGNLTEGTQRRVRTALRRLQKVGDAPERAQLALSGTAARLARENPADGEPIARAARQLAENITLFRHVAGSLRRRGQHRVAV